MKNKIFRFLRNVSKDGTSLISRADIIAPDKKTAEKACKEGRVVNWESKTEGLPKKPDGTIYIYEKEVSPEEAKNPKQPLMEKIIN